MSAPTAASGDRFRRLHAAQRVITSELTLDLMLERIAEAACDVIEVRYCALAVLASDDGVEHLVQRGVDDVVADHTTAHRPGCAALRDCTTGAELVRTLDDLSAGDIAVRHVDVLVEGEVFARLHLAAPRAGHFTDDDDEMIQAMSRSVGSALEHAQLFDRARRSTEWLHASGEIARALLADADVDMFGEIVARAVQAADADYGQLIVPTESGDLRLIATAGLGADELRGRTYAADTSDLCRSVVNGKTLRMADLNDWLSSGFDNHHGYQAFMLAPLIDAQGTRGSILVTRVAGRSPFTDHELDLFATYSAQVALAMQFADARADAERMQVLETRHDTARELHDIVMQRLFATGVGLQTLGGQLADSVHAEQLNRYVHELDDTIDEIRNRVFGLRGDAQSPEPAVTRFPRIALDAATTALDAAAAARDAGASALRSVVKRGRRRSDWHDGTGRQQG